MDKTEYFRTVNQAAFRRMWSRAALWLFVVVAVGYGFARWWTGRELAMSDGQYFSLVVGLLIVGFLFEWAAQSFRIYKQQHGQISKLAKKAGILRGKLNDFRNRAVALFNERPIDEPAWFRRVAKWKEELDVFLAADVDKAQADSILVLGDYDEKEWIEGSVSEAHNRRRLQLRDRTRRLKDFIDGIPPTSR